MFKRIVVPLDSSPRAERALPVAVRLARASGGSLVLLQVVLPPIEYAMYLTQFPVLTEPDIEESLAQAIAYLTRVAQSDELEGLDVRIEALSAAPVSTLFEYAQSCQADLIVMCSHGYSGFKRWALGSVADSVTRHAPVPVLVLRDGGSLLTPSPSASERPLRVLVPLDGSALAETALEPAAQLVAALSPPGQGALHLVRVVDIPGRYGAGKSQANIGIEMVEQAEQKAQAYLVSVVDQLQTGIAARLHLSMSASVIADTDVAGAILKEGASVEDDRGYSLIALSTHGRSGLERWAMGSITERVLHGTRLPLLIVRPRTTATKKETTEAEAVETAKSGGTGLGGVTLTRSESCCYGYD